MPNPTSNPSRNPTTPERNLSALETTLLASSPPAGTDVRNANEELLKTVQKATNLPSPAKRYIARLTKSFEKVAIKGKFVFNIREILEVVEKAEAEALTKKSKKRRRMKSTTYEIEEEEEEVLEILSEDSEGECI
ncbi:hypothetical protein M433DRAFT_157873, partial [Acidomyces richmondensis BFW]